MGSIVLELSVLGIQYFRKQKDQITVVQVTIRVGTLGYDLVPGICDTCQKTS